MEEQGASGDLYENNQAMFKHKAMFALENGPCDEVTQLQAAFDYAQNVDSSKQWTMSIYDQNSFAYPVH